MEPVTADGELTEDYGGLEVHMNAGDSMTGGGLIWTAPGSTTSDDKAVGNNRYIVFTPEVSGNISITFSGSSFHSKSKAARMYIVPGEDPSCMSKTDSDANGSQATAAGADTDTVLTAELDAGTTYYISCGDSLACTTKDASDAQLEPNRQFDNKEGDGQYATMTAELTAGMHYYIWAYYYNRDEANFTISEISYDTNQE